MAASSILDNSKKSTSNTSSVSSRDKSYETDEELIIPIHDDTAHSVISSLTDNKINKDSNHLDKGDFKFSNLPKRKKIILVYSTLTRILITASLSIYNPIFPKEAETKQIDTFYATLSFSIFYIIVFFTAPIIGKYVATKDPRFLFISSMYVTAVVNFCFATLHYGPGGTSYVVLVIICRVILALAVSANSTVTQSVISYEFQHNFGAANGILQTGALFGYVLGPALAGFFYGAGGYPLPFYVSGITTTIIAVVVHSTLPHIKTKDSASKTTKPSLRQLLRSPLMIISLLCTSCAVIGISNVSVTLTIHVSPFGITMAGVGLIFAGMDIFDTASNFVWSYLIDKKPLQNTAIIFGLVLNIVGFLVLGPSTLVPFIPSSVASICIGLSLIGIGFGSIAVPALKCMVDSAEEMGYDKNDLEVLSTISGLFNSIYWLGGFVGQFVIQLVVTGYDTVTGYTVCSGLYVFVFLNTSVFFLIRRTKKFNKHPSLKDHDKKSYSSLESH